LLVHQTEPSRRLPQLQHGPRVVLPIGRTEPPSRSPNASMASVTTAGGRWPAAVSRT
jgi:hypothetical protein